VAIYGLKSVFEHVKGDLPPTGQRIYIGYDDAGHPWLLGWALPGFEGRWSAVGLDGRRYPCVRVIAHDGPRKPLTAAPINIVRWENPHDK